MMNCDWTEKISLLIDGELAREEAARVESHLAACPACRTAHTEFLGLRHEIRAYEHAPDVLAQRRALKNILAAGDAGAVAAAGVGGEKTVRASGHTARVREWLSGAFGASSVRPALTAAALVLFVSAAGLLLFINRDDSKQTRTASLDGDSTVVQSTPATVGSAAPDVATRATPEVASRQGSEIETGNAPGNDAAARGGNVKRDERKVAVAFMKNRGAQRRKLNTLRDGEPERFDVAPRALPETAAAGNSAGSESASSNGAANNSAANDSAASNGAVSDIAIAGTARRSSAVLTRAPGAETARHVERAQVLLRSFRNARFNRSDPSYDAASQKERSRKLLYQNILLRRDAATRGDLPVENLLSRLEPVLLDIANLPDKPSSADVRPIRERIERKKMVALLQVHTPLASRSAY